MTASSKTKTTRRKPAVRVVAPSSAGSRGKLNASDPRVTLIENTASVIPWLIKFAVVGTVGYFVYRAYTTRFTNLKQNSNYPDANISDSQAETRADAIYSSIGWFSNDFDNVKTQFVGLNYNAIVKVYNAFGNKTGTLLGGDLNLFEWCRNQFTQDQMAQLRFITGGAFF